MDIVFTDKNKIEQGVISDFVLDMAFGEDENDFELTVSPDFDIEQGAYIYIDGYDIGGIVRGWSLEHKEGISFVKYTGHTWHGILEHSVICPNSGQAYWTVSGDANVCILAVITRQGFTNVFDVETLPQGTNINYQFERYTNAYAGLLKMLKTKNLKLVLTKEASSKPKLKALPIADYTSGETTYDYDYLMTNEKPINHLVCLGEGELEARKVIHLYADVNGNVSQTKTQYGLNEITEVYDYSSASDESLLEDGTKKLLEYQATKTAELNLPEDMELDIGDLVGFEDDDTGRSLSASITKEIIKVNKDGIITKSYELGDINARF